MTYYYLINFPDIKIFVVHNKIQGSNLIQEQLNVMYHIIPFNVHENQEFFPIRGNEWKLISKKYSRSHRLYRYISKYFLPFAFL